MAEMLLKPTYPEGEVTTERQVVIEEIAMYEDEPSDKVHDVLDEAIFGEHPLGARVIGSADVIGSIPIADIAGYHDARYTGTNIVVAAAGHLDHDAIVALSEKLLSPAAEGEDGGAAARAQRQRAARRLPAEGHRAVPPLPRGAGDRPRR